MRFSKILTVSLALSAALLVGLSYAPAFSEETPTTQAQDKAEVQAITPATEPAPTDPISDMAQHPAPPIDVLPAKTAETSGIYYNVNEITHPQIEMTPDKSELVRIDQDAASIIVGNPNHLSIMAESARLLVLVPREAGATYFTVLNGKGEVIMQRHVLVAAPKEKYVRVRRSCVGSANKNCQETSVYYCPDMCHQIIMADPSSKGGGGMSAAATTTAGAEGEAGTESSAEDPGQSSESSESSE